MAITRARKNLLIYDRKTAQTPRFKIAKYWKNLGVASEIKDSYLSGEEDAKLTLQEIGEVKRFKALLSANFDDQYRKMGIKLLNRKSYKRALWFFEKAHEDKLAKRAKAYLLAEEATKGIQTNNITKEKFRQAADIFKELGLYRQAGQCLFSADDLLQAAEVFREGGYYQQAAETFYEAKSYELACEYFEKVGDYVRAIECAVIEGKYEKTLEMVDKYIKGPEREVYAKQYVPLALETLISNVDIKMYGEKKPVEVEQEKEKNAVIEEEEDDEEEEEKEGRIEANPKPSESKLSNSTQIITLDSISQHTKKEISEISFDNLEIPQLSKDLDELSFSELANSDSYSYAKDKGQEQLEGFDHLSNFDPDDEWLQMEKGTITESISEIRRQKSAIGGADYSAVYFMNNPCQLVNTKQNIFVQDSVMSKIIKIISTFHKEIKSLIEHLNSKAALLSQVNRKSENSEMNLEEDEAAFDFIIDLDSISLDFVYFTLDLLEYYKLYKLCIFVCNRYNLSKRIGRYVVNVANKYSNFLTEDMSIDSTNILNPWFRQAQLEKAFIANTALHTVLENINPILLNQKKKGEVLDQRNSLGYECFQKLISLGFWKKCLFIMDYDNSLALAAAFSSFKNYKMIFLQGNPEYNANPDTLEKELEKQDFNYIPFKIPRDAYEINYACMCLDAVMWDLTEKMPWILNKQYVTLNHLAPANKISIPSFPSYFKFNETFWRFIFDRSDSNAKLLAAALEEALIPLAKIFKGTFSEKSMTEVLIYDLTTFFMLIYLYAQFIPAVNDIISNLHFESLLTYIDVLRHLAQFTANSLPLTKYSGVILSAILNPLRYSLF